jgi:two-component system nitrogen regulation response regulator NtrX
MNAAAHDATNVIRTLIVDDDPHFRESLRELLELDGYVTLEAGDGKTALDMLDTESIDVLLLDLELPRIPGMAVLREVADRHLDIPVVIISGTGTIPEAVSTMRLGAFDYIEKPFNPDHTLRAIRNAIAQRARQQWKVQSVEAALQRYGMVGSGPAIQRVFHAIDRAAATLAKVLISGESGTGKELAARAIHRLGRRGSRPFVALNCAAVPEQLIESDLFGHVKGAFTGADRNHAGCIAQADGGTLFLDEIGEMSLMTQAKVLRAIETGEIRAVGAALAQRSDFRLITATNKDLLREVGEGNFREDLYYRLSVIAMRMPPLRERREDIADLAEHLLGLKAGEHGMAPRSLTPAAIAVLAEQPWPGNVRQLANVIEQLLIFSSGSVIHARDVRESLQRTSAPVVELPSTLREARAAFEREHILATLVAHDWHTQEAAQALGINRSHLWKKVKRLGIEPPPQGP